jgi:hypothetical protein
MRIARNGAAKAAMIAETRREGEDLVDADVPAAVVCAHCGDADCPGCLHEITRSGVVALVAWERPGTSAFARLWATARATTFDADRFFASLPAGPLMPAVRFALASEMIASSAMILALLVPLSILAPAWAKHLFLEHPLTTARLAAAAIPGLALLLVVAHVAHGWALDRGAQRSGARGAAKHAVRFGLYAAGWDLVVGPFGAVVVATKEGLSAAISIATVGVGLPGRSARAFLRGCYHLEGKSAEPALRASFVAAALATGAGAVVVIAALLAALLS